ncbi:MAG: VOC family protein [Flavobacteriales bacterium]|nr:VOC family protein [Flavobacteriales bacterium]
MGTLQTKSTKKKVHSNLSWFEIPVYNIQRAVNFYNFVLGLDMKIISQNGYSMARFPSESGIDGALMQGPGCIPSELGTLVYLHGGDDLSSKIANVEPAGGRIIMGKTLINKNSGYFALFIDTEGNKMALHSME